MKKVAVLALAIISMVACTLTDDPPNMSSYTILSSLGYISSIASIAAAFTTKPL